MDEYLDVSILLEKGGGRSGGKGKGEAKIKQQFRLLSRSGIWVAMEGVAQGRSLIQFFLERSVLGVWRVAWRWMNLESGSQLGAIPAFWGRGDEGTGLRVNGRAGGGQKWVRG